MKIKKVVYMILGFISLSLGALGALLPILPTVPFLMMALVCFAKSSERLHRWFTATRLYKNNLESYVENREMTKTCKIKTVGLISILMLVGFILMFRKGLYIPCGILFFVWICHVVYFAYKIKTKEEK